MVSEERLLVEERDEYGVIRVIESGDYRFLEFGDGVEQSCVFMPDPAWLE
ncbi:spermidine synthase, partial [Pseudomonas aeruginosa]